MGEFGVSEKEGRNTNSSSGSGSVLGLGVRKLQSIEAFPNKMMVHHNHHHRPLLPFDNAPHGCDRNGPTCCVSMSNHINHVGGSVVVSGAAVDSGGAAVRPLQPFDISNTISTSTTHTAFKSPVGMAASLGFPFTNAQWKELERQAMIYKYMMASVPVPPDLLVPLTRSNSVPDASFSPLNSAFNLRLSNSTDPEPGRCRRTDGKKWRCSRDVAPNKKYCERHMHRGRPRSRKPVEVHANIISSSCNNNNNNQIKRSRHDYNAFPTSSVTVAISNPTINENGSSSQFLTSTTIQAYHQSLLSLDKYNIKAATFDSLASTPSDKEPRSLDWMLKGDPVSTAASDPQWQPLMQTKVGLTTGGSFNNNSSIRNQNYEEPLYLDSYSIFNSEEDQHNKDCHLFLNPDLVSRENHQLGNPRNFIDAWSNTETDADNANARNQSPASSNGKLSLSCLNLSMGGSSSIDEDMDQIQMGLGLMESNGNTESGSKTHLSNWLTPGSWVSSTPGGPLAEVLRPSSAAATTEAVSNSSSPVNTNGGESGSPLATVASSPSGVLHKTLASLSDSSSSSSPTVASARANSEIAMLWLNQSKLGSST
ncbi:Growth-regulating factor [Quillaja saponaria]|uniref:Growth-regulating factor n=1 Tax=Quillaja saponaria TaxID=32244 RepID=A0AAD7LW86_QUISA|nr:Growth-regulating factor [Quillaja saponaria]